MFRASRTHLAEAGETYFEHMQFALVVAALAIGSGVGCLIHAFVPSLCQRTCSRTISSLQSVFHKRDLLQQVRQECSGVLTFVFLLALSGASILFPFSVVGLTAVTGAMAVLTFAIPLTFLLRNGELGPSA